MKVLYIYPHPDDESFGPAPAIAKQRRSGHEVHLLTLTRGGATKQRRRFGYSVEQMGIVRLEEMQQVKQVLSLNSLSVLDFPDSGLKEVDPREIESAIALHISQTAPEVVVTYPVHGVSGFHDHLVCHAIVKRVFCALREELPGLRRLAFHTVTAEQAAQSRHFTLAHSAEDEIDCLIEPAPEDSAAAGRALDCYKTFAETIDRSGIRDTLKRPLALEFFQEHFSPPLDDLFAQLPQEPAAANR